MRKFIRHKKSRILAAFVLVFCLLLTLPLIPKGVAQADSLDLKQDCSLTVNPGDFDGLKGEDVRIDLYKVASAKKDSSYDTCIFEEESSYKGLLSSGLDQMDNERWRDLAQRAAKITFKEPGGIEPTKSDNQVGKKIEVDWGLYLVIARGTGLTDYISTIDGEQLVTKAYSGNKCYTYLPELVALPSTAGELSGQITTDSGEWKYDLTVTLKPEQSDRFVPLDIVKTLLRYVDVDIDEDEDEDQDSSATFVFQIDVYENQEDVGDEAKKPIKSDVVSFVFDSAGEKRITLADWIPAGKYVVVTEIYTGSAYVPVENASQGFVMPETGTKEVFFVNDYNDSPPGDGGSIVNHYEFHKSTTQNENIDEAVTSNTEGSTGIAGTWKWTQLKDNTAE